MTRPIEPGEARFTITDGALALSVVASAAQRCPDCEDIHVVILKHATADTVRSLAAGIAHLAERAAGGGER